MKGGPRLTDGNENDRMKNAASVNEIMRMAAEEALRPLDEAKPVDAAMHLNEAAPPDEALRALLPVAARCLERLMDDEKTPATARIKCVEIVLERVFGKAGADAPGPLVLSGANELAD